MNGKNHKLIALIIFAVFYFFNLFPTIINNYLNQSWINIMIGIIIAYLFSGGRITNKSWLTWGLSSDNDFHKKMKRDWLLHSGILPTILVLLIQQPITYLIGFFYASHVAVDLLNTRSWEGTKYTYIAVFLTTVLFYGLIYSI